MCRASVDALRPAAQVFELIGGIPMNEAKKDSRQRRLVILQCVPPSPSAAGPRADIRSPESGLGGGGSALLGSEGSREATLWTLVDSARINFELVWTLVSAHLTVCVASLRRDKYINSGYSERPRLLYILN